MSKVRRGARVERLAADKLKEDGWLITKAIRTQWQRQDMFGCWDIIAVKEGEVYFIQVSLSPLYDRGVEYKKKLAEFPHPNKEYWWYKGRSVWEITRLEYSKS